MGIWCVLSRGQGGPAQPAPVCLSSEPHSGFTPDPAVLLAGPLTNSPGPGVLSRETWSSSQLPFHTQSGLVRTLLPECGHHEDTGPRVGPSQGTNRCLVLDKLPCISALSPPICKTSLWCCWGTCINTREGPWQSRDVGPAHHPYRPVPMPHA